MVSRNSAAGPKLSYFSLAAEEWLSPDYITRMIRFTLEARSRVSPEAGAALDKAIISSGVRVPMGGFRSHNVHRAPSHHLHGPIQRILPQSEELAGALLKVWAEGKSDLYNTVAEYLRSKSVPMYGPDRQQSCFRGVWDNKIWQTHLSALLKEQEGLEQDDVGLMLWYVSGYVTMHSSNEDAPPEWVNFPGWLDLLKLLPADAPQWEEARGFADSVCTLVELKEEERRQASVNAFQAEITALVSLYLEELTYLEQETDLNSLGSLESPERVADGRELLHQLEDLLQSYRPIRDQAPVRSEETRRAGLRAELERQILETLVKIRAYIAEDTREPAELAEPARPAATVPLPAGAAEAAAGTVPAPAVSQAVVAADGQSSTEPPAAPAPSVAGAAINSPTATPVNDAAGAAAQVSREPAAGRGEERSPELDNQTLLREIETLKESLYHEKEQGEYWRHAYVDASRKQESGAWLGDGSRPRNVDEAIILSQGKFPGELLFNLNSRSWVKNNPYEDPQAVLDALEWLATTYYRSRTGEISVADLDDSIYRVCRWKYANSQSEVTMGRYESHYRTIVDGQTFRLKEHIGRGNSKDPANTIRIAFNWDKERNQVIIGYIGQHQQTDAT